MNLLSYFWTPKKSWNQTHLKEFRKLRMKKGTLSTTVTAREMNFSGSPYSLWSLGGGSVTIVHSFIIHSSRFSLQLTTTLTHPTHPTLCPQSHATNTPLHTPPFATIPLHWPEPHFLKGLKETLSHWKKMEGKEEDVRVGANRYGERQPIGTSAQVQDAKDYREPPSAPLFEPGELSSWSFYRAGIAEFVATFLFLYITILTVMGVAKSDTKCSTVGIQGIAWAFGGMIFALVYCTAGISGEMKSDNDLCCFVITF